MKHVFLKNIKITYKSNWRESHIYNKRQNCKSNIRSKNTRSENKTCKQLQTAFSYSSRKINSLYWFSYIYCVIELWAKIKTTCLEKSMEETAIKGTIRNGRIIRKDRCRPCLQIYLSFCLMFSQIFLHLISTNIYTHTHFIY